MCEMKYSESKQNQSRTSAMTHIQKKITVQIQPHFKVLACNKVHLLCKHKPQKITVNPI